MGKEPEIRPIPDGAKIIFKVITGSQSFGTADESSDTDYKGVYVQPNYQHALIDGYQPTAVINKDETYFEIKHFISLLLRGEALALEMIHSPQDCIILCDDSFKPIIENKELFLTKKTYYTFYEYAVGQFKKATNYNKMANWDKERVRRKDPSEFCKILYHYLDLGLNKVISRTISFKEYLEINGIPEDEITLSKMDGMPGMFKAYHFKSRGWFTENSNELRTGSVPYELKDDHLGFIVFNHSEYSRHCDEYRQYQKWLLDRNDIRYNTNKEHGQKYDAKNVMHTVRLIMVALEIPKTKSVKVRRSSDEREYLLSIKYGELDLGSILDEWLNKSNGLKEIYDNSPLPDEPPFEFTNNYLLKLRKETNE